MRDLVQKRGEYAMSDYRTHLFCRVDPTHFGNGVVFPRPVEQQVRQQQLHLKLQWREYDNENDLGRWTDDVWFQGEKLNRCGLCKELVS